MVCSFHTKATLFSLFISGQIDVHMLTLLQSILPDVSVTAEIVEPSIELIQDFKGTDDTKHHKLKSSLSPNLDVNSHMLCDVTTLLFPPA